jgi:predicted nucleotidyltransferase
MQNIDINLLKDAKSKYSNEGFKIIGIFGSFARDDATESSDLDILYELNETFIKKYNGFLAFARLSEIKQELKNIFGKDVDIAAKNSLSKTAKKYILKDLKYV